MRTVHTQPMNDTMTAFRLSRLTLAVGLALPATLALAQQQPDAGQTLQQTQPPTLQAPRPATGIVIQPPATAETLPGGQKVTLSGVRLTGHTVFAEAELLALLGEVKGQSLDLAGLRDLAGKIGQHYRDNGYPFARAFVPAQSFADGVLTIQVVEGRFGKVTAQGDEADAAQAYLAPLQSGEVITAEKLERTTLLLDDVPGFKTSPIIRPGQELGTGDLDVRVKREKMISGDLGVDNHGNRYTGGYRVRANIQADSPFLFGDQIQLRSFLSDESMWLGAVNYNLPLGASGLRGEAGYSQTNYELAKEFASSESKGIAKTSSLGGSYPILRSQKANVTLGVSWLYKELEDSQGGTINHKSSHSVPVQMRFDLRDGLGGGGLTYGSISATTGHLQLDNALGSIDQTTAKTMGHFSKTNLDLARVQLLPAGLIGFARVSAQWAPGNLDSSEGFGIGGPNGVRAYPSGEGFGDAGWLVQAELRYTQGIVTALAFYDAGQVKINANPWDTSANRRSLSGAGVGMRLAMSSWSADASIAWRVHGGAPTSDSVDKNPRLWATLGYRF